MNYWLSILFFIPFFSSSQVWVDEGATWHYDYWNISSGGFYRLEYTQDTTVGGQVCQQVETKKYSFVSDQSGTIQLLDSTEFPDQFTYVVGDTVFYWNDNQFFTLFNFGASIGDRWLIGTTNLLGSGCTDSSFVEVTNTGSITINSSTFRTITLATVDSSSIGLSGVFVERFGFLDQNSAFHPFPRQMNCNGDIVEYDMLTFKCFEDDAFTLYNPSGEDCEYYLTHLDVDEILEVQVSVQPNPFREWIDISAPQSGTLTIYDFQGTEVECFQYSNSTRINLSHVTSGMYLLVFEDESGTVYRKQALKI